jgi:CheY-like chemotaxis protein
VEADQVVILVVEDEPLLQLQLVDPLEEAGFKVLTAARGNEAITILEREGDNIRALITDVNLGGAITGWEVAQKARELNAQMPVVYTTSYPADDWLAHGVPKSIHIDKPFVPVQVITALSQLLNAASTPGATAS